MKKMKKEILLQKEFIEWLVNTGGLKITAAGSYCDYIAAADRTLEIYKKGSNEKSHLLAVLETEVFNGNSAQMIEIVDETIDKLSEIGIETRLNKSLKYIKNWKSALYKYKEFLYDYIDAEIEVVTDEETLVNDEVITEVVEHVFGKSSGEWQIGKQVKSSELFEQDKIFTHSQEDLYKCFSFRIITQDRLYKELFYPISFIKRLFYLKGERQFMNAWTKELLNKVSIHVTDGVVRLDQISRLEISNHQVHVESNGVLLMAFTKESDNKRLVPFSVNTLTRISLDHEKSMKSIMLENLSNLQIFKEITVALKGHMKRTKTLKRYKKACKAALESNFINLIDIDRLKVEMNLISSLTHLQFMDGVENTRKGCS